MENQRLPDRIMKSSGQNRTKSTQTYLGEQNNANNKPENPGTWLSDKVAALWTRGSTVGFFLSGELFHGMYGLAVSVF